MSEDSNNHCTRCGGTFLNRETVVAESEDPAWCRTCRFNTTEFFARWMFDEPTTERDSLPGSAAKVLILEKRYAAGLDLWQVDDFSEPSVFTPDNTAHKTVSLSGIFQNIKILR